MFVDYLSAAVELFITRFGDNLNSIKWSWIIMFSIMLELKKEYTAV